MNAAGSLRILVVGSDPRMAAAVGKRLTDHFPTVRISPCSSVAEAAAADVRRVALVLSDMSLPDGTGLDVLSRLLAKRGDLPVVLVTTERSMDIATEAIHRGAYDYVVKTGDYLFAIPLVVEKNLAMWRTKQENMRLASRLARSLDQVRIKNRQLERAVCELKAMATTDPLTGLANRRAIGDAVARSYAQCTRYGHDLACIMIDLDGFKQLNDAMGHQRGDEVLQAAARVLVQCCRKCDLAGRFGGDEFILLLPQTDMATARAVAGRVAESYGLFGAGADRGERMFVPLTMSVGLATLRRSGPQGPRQMIDHADRALYMAKQEGKARIKAYGPQAALNVSPPDGTARTSAASRQPASLSAH
jgi:diguanylate cyclase (GGDEF)-like protein